MWVIGRCQSQCPQKYFESCGLSVCEFKTPLLGDFLSTRSCPFPSEQFLKRCEIHWGRVDSICSKSIFHRALCLESQEGGEVSRVYKRKVRCIDKSFSLRF
ncbi:hypothetical protein CEXT_242041 [Caerostris extrusa]|uniref:Uncharacterized protein n=1 Tax=Caerostris extrusa TaxID=172846 RepID=A0AAV4WKP0_CAEEX|nr:hypothetical protein CEXT_242041 [Caerostris extrusa]